MAMGALLHPTSAYGGNDGPGGYGDYWANWSYYKGGPKPGYHVATIDPTKPWNEMITLKKTNGSDGEKVQNQRIAADAAEGTPAVAVDPCNGINSEGENRYEWDSSKGNGGLYLVKQGNPNAGYPNTPLENTVTNALRAPAYEQGLPFTKSGSSQDLIGYGQLSAEAKDYMLIYCGAAWCGKCDKFTPQFAKYYEQVQKDKPNSFDAVFLSLDEDRLQGGEVVSTAEQEFKEFYKKMPFKAPQAYSTGLADNVKRAAAVDYIPCVIVVDNKTGKVITTNGVAGMQGKSGSGDYPLPAHPELFQNQDDAACPTDAETQRKLMIEELKREVTASTDTQMLKARADELQKQFGGVVPQDLYSLRAYVIAKGTEKINAYTPEQVKRMYAKMQEDKNADDDAQDALYKKYKVGTQVRVLKDFTTDAAQGIPSYRVPSLYGNQPNFGTISAVDMGPDGVPSGLTIYFSDLTAYQRYVAKKNFGNIALLGQ